MEIKDILLILFPIISGIISSYFTYFFTSKSKHSEAILKSKEEKYNNLLVLLQGFIGITASGDLKREFLEELYKSWLYASDDVVKAINKMIQLIIDSHGKPPDRNIGREAVGAIVLDMRKDLLRKTKLSFEDFGYFDVID